jgi:putative FmdB family regulatory protein
MPIYEYRCDEGHTFEVLQRMTEDPLDACTQCGAPARRVLRPPAVHFKGSGFHNTDYGTRKRQKETAAAAESGAEKTESKAKEKSASKDGGGSSGDSKPAKAKD